MTNIRPDVIIEEVSRFYGIDKDEIRGRSKIQPIVKARHMAMYLIRDMLEFSYPAVAREFNGCVHTTPMLACENVRQKILMDREFGEKVEQLQFNIVRSRNL